MCYRGRTIQNCPKWLGEGAGLLVYVDQKPVALMHNRVALVQETLGGRPPQLAKTPFAPSPTLNALIDGYLETTTSCSSQ